MNTICSFISLMNILVHENNVQSTFIKISDSGFGSIKLTVARSKVIVEFLLIPLFHQCVYIGDDKFSTAWPKHVCNFSRSFSCSERRFYVLLQISEPSFISLFKMIIYFTFEMSEEFIVINVRYHKAINIKSEIQYVIFVYQEKISRLSIWSRE